MNFIENETPQKLRGGYYTPLDLAVFLTRWVNEIRPKKVLEPSCGDGVFFDAFAQAGEAAPKEVIGIEFNKAEAARARIRARKNGIGGRVESADFLGWALKSLKNKETFDAVIGNPPFIRYQYLPPLFQERAEAIFEELGLPFTKHTNAWVPFVLASMALLRPGGRLAMVIPAEIVHVLHAQSLRSYLGKECRRLVLVDPQELWFENTLQGVVLLLAEKRHSELDKAEGLGVYSVNNREFLSLDPRDIFETPVPINGRTISGKWTYALLDPAAREVFDGVSANPGVHRFNEIASVDVGIVTGANDFFLVPDEIVSQYHLAKWAHPMFGRSDHCPGIIYNAAQHRANKKAGKPTNFIWFPGQLAASDLAARKYIKLGRSQGLPARYKCRIRKPWYSVPSVYTTTVGMLKRSHHIPRLILNQVGALTTDTAYRIRTHGISSDRLVGSFVNSLTALSAELEGRHYGGGVLEMVPSEIERLVIPLTKSEHINLANLDRAIRTLPVEAVLKTQDRTLLGGLGVTPTEQLELTAAWQRLRTRRQRVSSDSLTA